MVFVKILTNRSLIYVKNKDFHIEICSLGGKILSISEF